MDTVILIYSVFILSEYFWSFTDADIRFWYLSEKPYKWGFMIVFHYLIFWLEYTEYTIESVIHFVKFAFSKIDIKL